MFPITRIARLLITDFAPSGSSCNSGIVLPLSQLLFLGVLADRNSCLLLESGKLITALQVSESSMQPETERRGITIEEVSGTAREAEG